MIGRIAYTAIGLAAGAITVRLGWHPGSANPAMPADRTTMIISVLAGAAMPWITRRRLGPVADDRFQAFNQSNWEADMRSGAIVSAVIIIALITGYAFAILAITARWTHATPPALAIGVAIAVAVYALMPLGEQGTR